MAQRLRRRLADYIRKDRRVVRTGANEFEKLTNHEFSCVFSTACLTTSCDAARSGVLSCRFTPELNKKSRREKEACDVKERYE